MHEHHCYCWSPCMLQVAITLVTDCHHFCCHSRTPLLPLVTIDVTNTHLTISGHARAKLLPLVTHCCYHAAVAEPRLRPCHASLTWHLPCYRLLPLLLPCTNDRCYRSLPCLLPLGTILVTACYHCGDHARSLGAQTVVAGHPAKWMHPLRLPLARLTHPAALHRRLRMMQERLRCLAARQARLLVRLHGQPTPAQLCRWRLAVRRLAARVASTRRSLAGLGRWLRAQLRRHP